MINDNIKKALTELSENDTAMYVYCKNALSSALKQYDGKVSRAVMQREFKIGFNQACRIMDTLQKLDLVENDHPVLNKPLCALISLEEFCELFPDAAQK